jgi:hypothetical protein
MRGKRFVWFLIMIAAGITAGLGYAWVINPVQYGDTSPETLRADYRADYVLMVAEIYQMDQNLGEAAQRLSFLGDLSPERIMADGILTALEIGYAPSDLELMKRLASDLQQQGTPPTAGETP